MKQKTDYNKKRVLFFSISALAVIALLAFTVRRCSSDDSAEYQFHKIAKGEIVRTVFVSGKVELASSYFVKSSIGGTVKKVFVSLNADVKKGALLAEIDASDLEFTLTQNNEGLLQANLSLESAKDAFKSKENLYHDNLIAKAEYEEAKRNLDRALSGQRAVQNTINRLKKDFRDRFVYAPVSGTIIQAMALPEMGVGNGTVLFQIVDNMKKMLLVLNVEETDIGNIAPGKNVEFSVSAYPDKKFAGKINSISSTPVMQGAIVTYTTWAECDNASLLLKPGMSASASIFVDRIDSSLRIPNEALSASPVFSENIPGKRFVWKKKPGGTDGDMIKVEIKTGLTGNGFTQVMSGDLKEGDEILIKIKKKKGKDIPGI